MFWTITLCVNQFLRFITNVNYFIRFLKKMKISEAPSKVSSAVFMKINSKNSCVNLPSKKLCYFCFSESIDRNLDWEGRENCPKNSSKLTLCLCLNLCWDLSCIGGWSRVINIYDWYLEIFGYLFWQTFTLLRQKFKTDEMWCF